MPDIVFFCYSCVYLLCCLTVKLFAMAGVIPKKSASGRKQWTLHGGPRSSLKRLRSQLASDGCPESQVVLAKQLLDEECEFKSEQRENARLGVYWLIKASEQGNLEATDLLKTCLKTGKGINEHNYMDVKSCISMTQDEKIARRAAREMFASMSNGGEYITSNQLQRKILTIDKAENCSKSTESKDVEQKDTTNGEIMYNYDDTSESDDETDWSQKCDLNNEKLTEDNIVSAAVTFCNGKLPAVNTMLCLTEPHLGALDHIPFVYWSILHPLVTLKIIYFKLIKFLGQKTLHMFFPLAKSEIQLLMLMLVYACVSSDNMLYFIPTLVYYASFLIMVVSTFQMLQTQRELHEFRLWTGLFICYSNGDLRGHSFETQFILNHTKPYCWFFFSLLVHYFCYPVTPIRSESELTVTSCCLVFMTLLGFMPKKRSKTVLEPLVLLSFAINILARYPYDTDPIVSRGWRYLELKFPSFPSYIVGNGIEFCISFQLLLYAVIPILLTKMASQDNWRGSYKILLPHLVTLSWLQYFALCSHNATTFGLYRAMLALVGSVLFLPLVGITSIILPVIAVTKWLVTSNVIYTICLFLILVTLCLGVCYVCAQTRFAKYTAVLQIILMCIAFFALLNSSSMYTDDYRIENENETPQMLHWEVFERLCRQAKNSVGTQTKCVELEGCQVAWDGYVDDVKVTYVTNTIKGIVEKLPKFIAQYLYYFYGEEVRQVCDNDSEKMKEDCVSFFNAVKSINKYTLREYNVYTYEANVKMQSGVWGKTAHIKLQMEHAFKNFTHRLTPDDHVWFRGSLFNNVGDTDGILGGESPYVRVTEIGCVACADSALTEMKLVKGYKFNIVSVLDGVYVSIKFVLNVLFNPVLIFK